MKDLDFIIWALVFSVATFILAGAGLVLSVQPPAESIVSGLSAQAGKAVGDAAPVKETAHVDPSGHRPTLREFDEAFYPPAFGGQFTP